MKQIRSIKITLLLLSTGFALNLQAAMPPAPGESSDIFTSRQSGEPSTGEPARPDRGGEPARPPMFGPPGGLPFAQDDEKKEVLTKIYNHTKDNLFIRIRMGAGHGTSFFIREDGLGAPNRQYYRHNCSARDIMVIKPEEYFDLPIARGTPIKIYVWGSSYKTQPGEHRPRFHTSNRNLNEDVDRAGFATATSALNEGQSIFKQEFETVPRFIELRPGTSRHEIIMELHSKASHHDATKLVKMDYPLDPKEIERQRAIERQRHIEREIEDNRVRDRVLQDFEDRKRKEFKDKCLPILNTMIEAGKATDHEDARTKFRATLGAYRAAEEEGIYSARARICEGLGISTSQYDILRSDPIFNSR